jgi:protein ImuB
LGESRSPLIAVQPKVRITTERRFAEPIAHVETVLDIIEELAAKASKALEERKAGGRAFGIELFRSDGAIRRMTIETSLPTRDPATIIRLLEERIDALSDPIDPGFGFDSIAFHVLREETLAAVQPALDGKEDRAASDLVDQLSTRLGSGHIRRIVRQDSHIPEQAQLALPAIHETKATYWPQPAEGEPPVRPLFLLDPPQPVEVVMVEVPDGPPRQFRWKGQLHTMRGFEGPERIGAEWWRRKNSGGRIRDYYRVEDNQGRRFWLFRHGQYDEMPDPKWYLHGLFA